MLDEAIKLIEKQISMYSVLESNTWNHAKNKITENKLKSKLKREIQLRKYILKILKKQKK